MRRLAALAAWFLPVLLLVGLLGYAVTGRRTGRSVTAALARGEHPPAPDFVLPVLHAVAGETAAGPAAIRLSALRGGPVLVNFWASWCVPCRTEVPLLNRLAREYGPQGLRVLGVNIQDLEPEARRFIRQYRVAYPNVRDRDGRVPRAYGVTGVPETFFVDARGHITRKVPGALVDYAAWEAAARTLLAPAPAR